MRVKQRTSKRLLSGLLTLALCLGEFSSFGLNANAEDEKTITGLGTGGITDPVAPASTSDAWRGSYVYYGKYDDQPVKYRVLDKDSTEYGVEGGSVFLDCDSCIATTGFLGSCSWEDAMQGTKYAAKVKEWLNGEAFFMNTEVFDSMERNAIASNILLLERNDAINPDYGYSDTEEEADNRIKAGDDWWILGTEKESYYQYMHCMTNYYYSAVFVTPALKDYGSSSFDAGISPAFNLKRPSILFSSLISGTSGQPGAEYKLTLIDSDISIAPESAVKADAKIVIPYKITSTGTTPNRVSVVVTDGTWTDKGWSTGAQLLQYAKLDMDSFSMEGSGSFVPDSSKLIGKWGTDYHVYLVAEDVNGKYESDYASAPVEVTDLIEETYKVTFDLNGKEGTAPATKGAVEGGKITAPTDVPVVTGYSLEGWYKEAGCINKWDFENDTVTADITLYAKWTPISYTVKYDPNKPAAAKGDVSGTTADSTHTYDEAKALTANGYSLEGYMFSGWNTSADGSGDPYSDMAAVKNLAGTEGAIVTLYAQWKEYSHSALDPVPDINDSTTEIWLVKGQKFTLDNWSLDESDKDKLKAYKKLISISKKGKVNAKKPGTAVIVKKDVSGNIVQSISVNITKPELTNKKLKLEADVKEKDTGSVALKNADNIDVYYYSTAPDVAQVDSFGNVIAVAKGSAKIIAYANGTAYTATVSVKEPSAVKNRTLHLSIGSSQSVKISGVKKTTWDYAEGTSDEAKAIVSIKGAKITAEKAGTVILIAHGDLYTYTMKVKVDDPSITAVHEDGKYDLKAGKGKNKYELVIGQGQKLTLSYADIDQPVIFKSSKPEIAFIDEYGNIEARGIGKGKFTAKVNGKAITISVNVK
ncbi:MAG: InlB B-repeat-containing protein [Lachnospiraceae bacterium]|nr:InlB B-repeat-containing protein [Lachnospiraceae bacterium]